MTRLLSVAARTVDARSTRSRQRKVGASEIGVCRRRAGYSHHGAPVSNPENVTGVAAINGTWIHKGALDVMRREWGALIEQRVENEILRGHVDAIHLPNDLRVRLGLDPRDDAPDVVEVEDLKTKRDGRLVAYVRSRGPKRSELYQGHLYAGMLRRGEVATLQRQEGLAQLGEIPVELIRLRYWSRAGEQDDTGQEYPHEVPFDPQVEAEALEWVEQVARSENPEVLPRDEDGPGLSIVCDNCPFVTACWGEDSGYAPQAQLIVTDADLAATMAEYDEARTQAGEWQKKKELARAKLDATPPAIYTDGRQAFRHGWSGGKMGDPKPDVDAMVGLFVEAGLEVPYLPPAPTPKVIHLTRWEVPEVACGKPVGDPQPWDDDEGRAWTQDRPRGGWTGVYDDGAGREEITAAAFAKRYPQYEDPRPSCVLKKGHSSDCHPDDFIRVLETAESPADAAKAS